MKAGDVALAALPQSDGRRKLRPVLLLTSLPPYGDWLSCGISTQLHHEAAGFDELVDADASDFGRSGLRAASLIRLGFLATISNSDLAGAVGEIAGDRLARLRGNLASLLTR